MARLGRSAARPRPRYVRPVVADVITAVSAPDTGTGSDSVQLLIITQLSVADAGTGSDSATMTVGGNVADTGTAADAAALAAQVATSDSGAGADTVRLGLSSADAAAGAETVALAAQLAAADTATGLDTPSVARFSALADVGTGADSVVPTLLVDDVGVGTDTATVLVIPDAPAPLPGQPQTRPTPVYELVCVARIPSVSGPPALIEVDGVKWDSLQYSDTLSAPQGFTGKVPRASLSPEVLQRLKGPDRLATEFWLRRDGQLVFAGPLRTWRRQGDQVEISADGILAYAARMIVLTDLRYAQVDQFLIAKQLIDQWQGAYPYAHHGIDTSDITGCGVLRDRTYVRDEIHQVLKRVTELGDVSNGFDLEVDPTTRKLQLWYPQKGTDRSTGGDAIVFDEHNIDSPDVMCSVSPDDLASYAFGTGTASGSDSHLSAFYFSPELAAAYGAGVITGTWQDVSTQTTLNDHVLSLLRAHQQALLVPGPKTRVTADVDLDAYDVGDTVKFEAGGDELGADGAFRIRKRTVDVEPTGVETVSLEFV